MASPVTHAVVALTLGRILRVPSWMGWLGVLCVEVPDVDVVGYWVGVPYDHFLGHRGFTHSIVFAILFSWGVSTIAGHAGRVQVPQRKLWSFLFLVTLSHGLFDALTNGGLGITFFSPFDQTRYFFPVRPIEVSPLSLGEFIGPAGVTVLVSEAMWVWLPCVLVLWGQWWISRRPRVAD